jgi:CheY-like chemotaxis protein
VLVVDDNLDSALMLTVLLREMGHTVAYAIDAQGALLEARRFVPEVVFLDLLLPDVDGAELARRLRREPGLGAVRIYALTGSSRDEDHEEALAAGCDSFLVKPVDPAFLDSLLGAGPARVR